MKIIHCADIHLGSGFSYIEDREKRRERQAELLETYRRMFRYAVLNNIEAIIIAGDLFDSDQVAAPIMGAVIREITDHPDISVYYLKGNHDVSIKGDSRSGDDMAYGMENIPNLFCFTDTMKIYSLHNSETAGNMHGLHNSKAAGNTHVNINIAGVELDSNSSGRFYDEIDLPAEDFNILVLHGQLYENGGSDALAINKRLLQHKNIDYLALGHIHAYRSGSVDSRGIYCYPGCLEGRGFDECGSHGFTVLDVNTEDGSCERSFVEFAQRKLSEVQVDITNVAGADILRQVEKSLDNSRCLKQDMVKVELTGTVYEEMTPVCAYIKSALSERYYYVRVKDSTRRTNGLHNTTEPHDAGDSYGAGTPYNAEDSYDTSVTFDRNSFRKMFRDTVMDRRDIPETDREEIIRLGIMALNGEELI